MVFVDFSVEILHPYYEDVRKNSPLQVYVPQPLQYIVREWLTRFRDQPAVLLMKDQEGKHVFESFFDTVPSHDTLLFEARLLWWGLVDSWGLWKKTFLLECSHKLRTRFEGCWYHFAEKMERSSPEGDGGWQSFTGIYAEDGGARAHQVGGFRVTGRKQPNEERRGRAGVGIMRGLQTARPGRRGGWAPIAT